MSTTEPILKINNIEVKYHEVIRVLKGVSIEVPLGGIVALLGANGAGKSTTLKAISGLLKHENGKVTDGSVEFMGQRIDRLATEKIARLGIVQVIEGRRVFEHLTVEQNLKAGAHLRQHGFSIRDGLDMVYQYFPRLYEKRHETAGFISGGEQQMTVVGRAMMSRPRLILLYEPSMGLAPLLIHEIFNIITRLNEEEKISILLVEHERAEKLRQKKANFFNTFTPTAREILNSLLEKYADYGIGEFDQLPRVLQISPFDHYGSPYEIYQMFGGAEKLLQAVDEMQRFLYE